jgi:hypothetical protein
MRQRATHPQDISANIADDADDADSLLVGSEGGGFSSVPDKYGNFIDSDGIPRTNRKNRNKKPFMLQNVGTACWLVLAVPLGFLGVFEFVNYSIFGLQGPVVLVFFFMSLIPLVKGRSMHMWLLLCILFAESMIGLWYAMHYNTASTRHSEGTLQFCIADSFRNNLDIRWADALAKQGVHYGRICKFAQMVFLTTPRYLVDPTYPLLPEQVAFAFPGGEVFCNSNTLCNELKKLNPSAAEEDHTCFVLPEERKALAKALEKQELDEQLSVGIQKAKQAEEVEELTEQQELQQLQQLQQRAEQRAEQQLWVVKKPYFAHGSRLQIVDREQLTDLAETKRNGHKWLVEQYHQVCRVWYVCVCV